MRARSIITLAIVVAAGCGPHIEPTGRPASPPVAAVPPSTTQPSAVVNLTDEQIEQRIGQLSSVSEWGVGYTPTMTGSDFLPLAGQADVGALLLGQKPPVASALVAVLVAAGPKAVPHLVAHIDNMNETKLKVSQDGFPAAWSSPTSTITTVAPLPGPLKA
jgi:hypothetical protein